ncbi:MAG: hypothetical protein ACI97A_001645 [Planctomycetota bacterium]|jgi:hypothetical protein
MRLALVALVSLFCLNQVGAQDDGFARKGSGQTRRAKNALEQKAPPQLQVGKWINSEKEISLKSLTGQVVLLDFWGTT